MAASQNGWVANQRDRVASQQIPGSQVKVTVRKDAPGLLLLEVAAAFDRLVEDVDLKSTRGEFDDWGYAERPIRGGTALSNHASGTAIDLNATRHPLGVPASTTFSPAQIATIRKIMGVTGGVVRWGGEWSRPDAMHFEIAPGKTMADCERALADMRRFNAVSGGVIGAVMDLNQTWIDHYSGRQMKVGDLISWGPTHSARAVEQIIEARKEIGELRKEVQSVREEMRAAIAEAVAEGVQASLGSYELFIRRSI